MVEILLELKTNESEQEFRELVSNFVARLTGKQTIYQMIELAEQVRRRGGAPLDPLIYKRMYHDRLWERIRDRVEALRRGDIAADALLVPGARHILENLRARGLRMYLASGTDEVFMQDEARLLDVERYFDGGLRGALDDYTSFSKRLLIEQLTSELGLKPGELLAFGDGYVEIENTRAAGGIAVGVATDEPACRAVNEWKRRRLIEAGAQVIIPNFLESDRLLAFLFEEDERVPLSRIRPQPPETSAAE